MTMTTATSVEPRLLTVAQTATYIGRTEKALRWLMHTGRAPRHQKIANRVTFDRADVDAWIDAAVHEATA